MIKKILIIFQEGHHLSIISAIDSIFKKNNSEYYLIEREKIKEEHYNSKDLVIVIGGDGTFLRASHLNKDIPMIGINPNPKVKEGFYMQANLNETTN